MRRTFCRRLLVSQSYQDAFDILGASGVLEPTFAFHFAKIAGFRNFLAHDYDEIDPKTVCRNILSQLDDIKEYLAQIEKAFGLAV